MSESYLQFGEGILAVLPGLGTQAFLRAQHADWVVRYIYVFT